MIQHTLFFHLYKIMLTDNKYSKLLEQIMIEYTNSYNDNSVLYNNSSKIYVFNEFDA